MEKLKPKHDHKLTDIIKVAIFGLMLLLPFISWMPNAFYYGFNEHAVVGQEEQYYNFYQGVKNGKPINLNDILVESGNETDYFTYYVDEEELCIETYDNEYLIINYDTNIDIVDNDIIYCKFHLWTNISLSLDIYPLDVTTFEVPQDYEGKSFDFSILYNYDYGDFQNSISMEGGIEENAEITIHNIQLFNLTSIFGRGNEPTKEQFENMLTQDYYNYGNNYVLKDRGTNITWSMFNSWEDVWQTPLFSWTNNSILKTGLNAFCGAFGIVDSSYITNFLVYELVIVAIYIVLDIVLTLFKWLTHIGQKE